MDVAIDVRATQSRTFGERGVARYARGLVSALLDAGAPLTLLALDPSLASPESVPTTWRDSGLLAPASISTYRRLRRPFALHLTSPFEMGRPVGGASSGPGPDLADRLVATVYDLIPATMPEIYLADHALRRAYEARMDVLRRADLLLAISEHSRVEAIEMLGVDPARVVNVGTGAHVPRAADPADDRAVLASALPELRRRPVLSITGYEPRKNTLALIDAYARLDPSLRADLQLLLVCSIDDAGRDAWMARARDGGLDEDEVVVSGKLSDEALAAAHRAAHIAVFPSLAEGFGLPVLEAAQAGVPVITSSTTATPEVLDLPASTFDPRDLDDMASTMTRAIDDDAFRHELVAAGGRAVDRHTWAKVAERTMTAYASLEPRTHRRPEPRTRIAVVGPFVPAVSGVATYNERVARRLGRRCDLTVFAEHAPWSAAPRPYRLHPLDVLDDQIDRASFDRVVHTIGNSLVHRRTLLDALAHPDVVWLHEVDLRELHLLVADEIRTRCGRDAAFRWLNERLRAGYGIALTSEQSQVEDLDTLAAALPPMTAELSGSASAIIVSTSEARDRLLEDRASTSHVAPIHVLPLAVPDGSDLALSRGSSVPGLVASFGILGRIKRPELIIDALAIARRTRPLRLVFVGPADDDLRSELDDRAAALGLAGEVQFTGHTDAATYGRWLSSAQVAVQLRASEGAEMSGAVADALAAGVPVVTDMADEASGATVSLPRGADADTVAGAILDAMGAEPPEHDRPTFEDLSEMVTDLILG